MHTIQATAMENLFQKRQELGSHLADTNEPHKRPTQLIISVGMRRFPLATWPVASRCGMKMQHLGNKARADGFQ
jgi:hypothetical protein